MTTQGNNFLEPKSENSLTADPDPSGALPDLGDFDPLATAEKAPEPKLINKVETGTMSKCPKCGSPDIEYLQKTGSWICAFCRFKWDPTQHVTFDIEAKTNTDIRELKGTVIVGAAANIALDSDQLTMKCPACGAEVIVDTRDAIHARCHWCRQTLSLNEKVPNGAVPDAILPFSITKEAAVASIAEFVNKRKLFALPKFTREFNPENVMGVYLPYAMVDGNLSGELHGQAEIETKTWTEKSGKSTVRYYNADVYNVSRKFDFQVDDLTLESSKDKSNIQVGAKQANTNNIINSIMPFDTKNAISFKSTYMAGFNSERRDMDVETIAPRVKDQFMSIARHLATEAGPEYDKRGVRWDKEHIEVKGTRWVSLYLPVWLYSYYQADKDLMHYVAVNGRTGEIMGSVPVYYRKLWAVTLAIAVPMEIIALAIVGGYYGLLFL